MKTLGKILGVVLCLTLMLGLFTVGVSAAGITYTFSEYEGGVQYAENEVHTLDNKVTVTTNFAHFTTQLRLYDSSSYDGTAVIAITGDTVTSIVLNAGNKAADLIVSTSANGTDWSVYQTITTTTSYTDYTVDFTTPVQYIKLDASGNQIRVAYMTLTYSSGDSGSSGGPTDTTDPADPALTPVLTDGTYVIATADGKALTVKDGATYGYLPTTDVTGSGSSLTGWTRSCVWTITNVYDGTTYQGATIQDQDGNYLYMSGTYNSFNWAAEVTSAHLWKITENSGVYTIVNIEKGKTVAYGSGYSTYGAYESVGDNDAALTITAVTLPNCYHTNTTLKSDNYQHWYDCANESCGEQVGDKIDHIFGSGDTCTVCGVTQLPADGSTLTITQANEVALRFDHNTFSQEKYVITGEVVSVGSTTYGNITIQDAAGNTLYLYGVYAADGTTRYDAMDPQPVKGDTITVSTVLGTYNGSTQAKNASVTAHQAHSHDYSWTVDETDHYQVCSICNGKTDKCPNTNMTYDTSSTETHKQICACGYVGDAEAHTLAGDYINGTRGHYQLCSVCSGKGAESGHTYDGSYQKDGDNHWQKCESCDHTTDPKAHTYAGDLAQGKNGHYQVCECGAKGPEAAHEKGEGDKCACGFDMSHDHEWVHKTDAEYHWDECSVCQAGVGKEKHSLIQKTDDDNHWKVCEDLDCDYTTEPETHNWTYEHDENGHWTKCACGAANNTSVAHTYTDNKCICGYQKPAELSYNKVTSGTLVSGKYVLVSATGYAPTVLDGNWLLSAQPTVSGAQVTDPKDAILILTVEGSKVTITDAAGNVIKGKTDNKVTAEEGFTWNWEYKDGKFYFNDGNADELRYLALNTGDDYLKFRSYKASSIEKYADSYDSAFDAYLLSESTGGSATEPTNPGSTTGGSSAGSTTGATTGATTGGSSTGSTTGGSSTGATTGATTGGSSTGSTTATTPAGTTGGSSSATEPTTGAASGTEDTTPDATMPTIAPVVTDSITAEKVDSIADGDKVIIYYPDGGLAVSGTADGTKLLGVEATVSGDKLTSADAAVMEVKVDANGYYSFLIDGKYLTSGETGNSLTLADAASDYSLWTLEAAEGGWYIKNVNAVYTPAEGEVRPQYLEYYYNFTTYSFNDSKANIYTFQFYKTSGTESTECVHENVVYKYDGNQHWSECSGCGAASEKVYHTLKNGKCVCGYEKAAVQGYYQVTSDKVTSGKYVLVVNGGYSLSALDGKWAVSEEVTVSGNQVVNPANVLTLTFIEGNKVIITDGNGATLYSNSDNNELADKPGSAWNWKYEDGKFIFFDDNTEEGQTRYLAFNASENGGNRFRAYRLSSMEKYADQYAYSFTLYQLTTSTGTSSSGNSNTGDDSVIGLAIAAAVLAVMGSAVLLTKKKAF